MLALLSTCASVSWAPVAGMFGRMRTRCPPQLFSYLQTRGLQHPLEPSDSDLPAAASCPLSCSGSWGQLLSLISEHLEALLCQFGEDQRALSFFQSLNLLQWLSWWGFQEVFLPVLWRCNFQLVHIPTVRGASQPETIFSPRYSNILVWSFSLQ